MNNVASKLAKIQESLEEMQQNTRTTWYELLLGGMLRGAGVIIGSIVTVVFAGWSLAILGIIPGAEEIADYLAQILAEQTTAF